MVACERIKKINLSPFTLLLLLYKPLCKFGIACKMQMDIAGEGIFVQIAFIGYRVSDM